MVGNPRHSHRVLRASVGVRLVLALLMVACGDGGGGAPHAPPSPPPPRPPPVLRVPLLGQLDRAEVRAPGEQLGRRIAVAERNQPGGVGPGLWYAPPVDGTALRLPEMESLAGARLVGGLGLIPGSRPAAPEASVDWRLDWESAAGAVPLASGQVDLAGRRPGAGDVALLEAVLPGGPGRIVVTLSGRGLSRGVTPALHDLRVEQTHAPRQASQQRVVARQPLSELRAEGDSLGDLSADDPTLLEAFGAPVGASLHVQRVPQRSTFLVPRDGHRRVALQVAETHWPRRPVGAVHFAVHVDGVRVFGFVQSGVNPPPSRVLYADLGPPSDEPARVELVSTLADPDAPRSATPFACWVSPTVETLRPVGSRRRGDGPNVLLVVVDTLRADHLPTWGYARPTAPRLDAFAQQAVVFERALAPSSWTVPSMASLFTGQYAYTHGLYDEVHWSLARSVPTLAERFAVDGLVTACFMANPLLDRVNGSLRGFDHVESLPGAQAEQLHRAFLDWLDRHQEQRFFAVIHAFDPHDPYAAPGEAVGRFIAADAGEGHPGGWSRKWQGQLSRALALRPEGTTLDDLSDAERELLSHSVDLYDAEIAYWDAQFGRLVDDLGRRGLLDDTILVVTSDHGEAFGEHGMIGHGRSLHEELIHVPLMVHGPGIAPGRRGGLVGLIDVVPTLLRLTGVDGEALGGPPLVGRHLLEPGGFSEFLFAQTSHGERVLGGPPVEWQAMISPDGKVLRAAGEDGLRLFDLRTDPRERAPITPEPELAAALARLLDNWQSAGEALAGWQDGGAGIDDEARQAMRELGYIR